MAAVTIYTTPFCPYCARAKSLLKKKNVAFEEIDVMATPGKRAEMESRSGRRTVPQIFAGDRHLGGCDDIHALDAAGKLDPILAGA